MANKKKSTKKVPAVAKTAIKAHRKAAKKANKAVTAVIKRYREAGKKAKRPPGRVLSPQQRAYQERFPGVAFLPPPPDYVRPSEEAIEKARQQQDEYARLRSEMAAVRKSMIDELAYDPIAELQTLVKEALTHLTTGMTPEAQEEFRKRATKVLEEIGAE